MRGAIVLLLCLALLCTGCGSAELTKQVMGVGTNEPDFITVMTQTGQVIGTHETDDYVWSGSGITIKEGGKAFIYINVLADVEVR